MPSKVESPIRVTDNADGFSIAGGTTSRTLTVTGEAITLTATGATNVTLPTTGTLATLAGAESLTNKKLGSLTTNGFVKTSGGDGTLSVDTATYLTANQTITLTGNVTGSGATSIATTIAAGVVTNAMLAGSIAASKLTGTDIATVGTVTAGTWNATVIAPAYGGTGVANNAASTITISGNFATTLTVTATTSVTLPTSGTLLTTTGSGASLTGIVTTITGTANQVVASASTGAVTLSTPQSIGTASTPQFARMGLGAAADAATLLILTGGSVSASTPLINATQTWNSSGVTFTANKTNITDTASAAFSLLEDWQVGGVSKAGVVKDGTVYGGGFFKTAALGLSAATNLQGMGFGATSIGFAPNAGNYQFSVLTTGANQFNTSILGWSSTTSSSNAPDTGLARAAAGVVEVNNGTAGTLKQLYAGTLRTSQTTVANLPSASTTGTGARAFVTDASTTVILGLGLTVVGGGANKVPVYSDGTNWIIG